MRLSPYLAQNLGELMRAQVHGLSPNAAQCTPFPDGQLVRTGEIDTEGTEDQRKLFL
jgi:hypothetical protein